MQTERMSITSALAWLHARGELIFAPFAGQPILVNHDAVERALVELTGIIHLRRSRVFDRVVELSDTRHYVAQNHEPGCVCTCCRTALRLRAVFSQHVFGDEVSFAFVAGADGVEQGVTFHEAGDQMFLDALNRGVEDARDAARDFAAWEREDA